MSIYVSVILLVFVLNFLGYLIAFNYQTDKLTDISYSLSFICATVFAFILFAEQTIVHWLIFVLIMSWGIRIGYFLLRRIHKMGKDGRFDDMRKSPIRFGGFWLLQTGTVIILMLPVLVVFNAESFQISWMNYLGITISVLGLIIESVADYQKSAFKKNNPGKLMTKGLYRYVKYPNYSGEILFWIGIYIFGIENYNGLSWLSIVSPIWIFILLKYISGIPLIEYKRKGNYPQDSKEYQYLLNTPQLIPTIF